MSVYSRSSARSWQMNEEDNGGDEDTAGAPPPAAGGAAVKPRASPSQNFRLVSVSLL